MGNLLKGHRSNNFSFLSQHENAKTPASHLLDECKQYYKFGFTRNPYERILSWYALIHKNDPRPLAEERERYELFIVSDAASDFSTHYFHYNAMDYFTSDTGELKVDKIFRYENYDHAMLELCSRFNLDASNIPVLNSAGSRNYRDFYTSRSRHLIAEKCRWDIEYFGYSF